MSAASNPIVLSSSPEHVAPRAAPLTTHDSNELAVVFLRDSSPESVPSPSSLFRLPTRSRYFPKESLSDEPRTDNRPRRGTPSNSSERRRKRDHKVERSISEPAAGLDGVRPPLLPQKANAPKRTSGSNKKRGKGSMSETTTNKILAGRVAKSGSMGSQESDKTAIDASQCGSLRPKSPKHSDDRGDDDLHLEAALKRRLDWTPMKDTPAELVDASQEETKEGSSKDFGDLLAGYSFDGTTSTCPNDSELRFDSGPTKRRRINLVDNMPCFLKCATNDAIAEESTEDSQKSDRLSEAKRRPKQRSKKFTTLTARVTARYQSNYMHSRHPAENADEVTESADANVSKRKRKGTSRSKRQQAEVVILSPEEAVKSLNEQDLIFGTCSQLEREESPTMIRDMQAALRESEQNMASQPTDSLLQRGGVSSSTSTVTRFRAPKSLWSVAARDLNGSLIDAEVVDLTESSPSNLPTGNSQITAGTVPEKQLFEEKGDGSHLLSQPPRRIDKEDETSNPEDAEHAHRSMPNYNDFTDAALSERVAQFGFKPLKNRRKMVELLERCWETKYGSSLYTNDTSDQQAGPAPSTSHAASVRPQAAGEKPRKTAKGSRKTTEAKTATGSKRTTKADKNLCTTAEFTRHRTGETASRTQLNKPSAVTSYRDVEEIEDSEEEVIPSPSRLQNESHINHSPKGGMSSSVTSNPSRASLISPYADSTGSDKGTPSEIPDQITRAVRAQSSMSRGTRRCPTWHEKILMYDPIILEDFTTWLNTEGLGLVSEDTEVNVGSVRQWCESRGICCCYRRLNRF